MANTRGKSLSQEGVRRLVESLRAARLRLFDTPTADILRRLFGERRLVNGAPQRRDETTGRDFESDGQEAELGTRNGGDVPLRRHAFVVQFAERHMHRPLIRAGGAEAIDAKTSPHSHRLPSLSVAALPSATV